MAGCDTAKNTQIQFKSFVFNLNAFDFITRRATGFKPLRLNYWEIRQHQNAKLIFGQNLQKRSELEKKNITIKFCIFKLV